jgi:hypothetical protein
MLRLFLTRIAPTFIGASLLTVLLVRLARTDSISAEKGVPSEAGRTRKPHPLFGALKGLGTVAPGVDLTEPADPTWADLVEQS